MTLREALNEGVREGWITEDYARHLEIVAYEERDYHQSRAAEAIKRQVRQQELERGRRAGGATKAKKDREGQPLIPYLEQAFAALFSETGRPPGYRTVTERLEIIVSRDDPALFNRITEPRVKAFVKKKKKSAVDA